MPQDESKVTIAPKIDKAEARSTGRAGAIRIHNLVRGMAMGPAAFTRRENKILKIHRTVVREAKRPVGEVTATAT